MQNQNKQIILGIIIVIIAPIAVMLGMAAQIDSIDFDSPEIRQQFLDNMTDEQKEKLQALEDTLLAIEDEISTQELSIDPIKAQVIYLFTLHGLELDNDFYTKYIGCFSGTTDDSIFDNIQSVFGVAVSATDRQHILEICGKAQAAQTVPPGAVHATIARLCADDDTLPTPGLFSSPFHDRNWRNCVTSGFGSRVHPISGKVKNHAGIDLAAGTGTNIYAAKPGRVLLVGWDEKGYGNYIVVGHGGGEAMPEILSQEAFDVEIAAVSMLSSDDYEAFLGSNQLPEYALDRLKYTEAITTTPASCQIESYKAMLLLTDDDQHGVAVCGGDYVYRAGLFPNAREWLDRRISQMADFICELSHVPELKNPGQVDFRNLNAILDCTITAGNGIGEMLVQELEKRDEIADMTMYDGHFEVVFNPNLAHEDTIMLDSLKAKNLPDIRGRFIVKGDKYNEVQCFYY